MSNEIKVGDRVRTGVYVLGKWVPMSLGVVTDMSLDKSTALVDVMSLHGGAPWIHREQTSHLRKEPDNNPITINRKGWCDERE